MSVTIRNATLQEWKPLLPMVREAYPQDPILNAYPQDDALLAALSQQNPMLIIAEDNGIIGSILISTPIHKTHTLAELRYFFVKKEAQWKGTEAELLLEAERRIKKGKIETTIASTQRLFALKTEKNDTSFFTVQGYTIEGTLSNHFAPGIDAIIMGKNIQ